MYLCIDTLRIHKLRKCSRVNLPRLPLEVSMRVGIVAKTPVYFMFVCLFACISAAFTGQISVKFYIGGLHENISSKSTFA
jgi:hypothetical protein